MIVVDAGQRGSRFVEVRNLQADELARLQACGPPETFFRVSVKQPAWADDDDLPAIFGRYELRADSVRFHPHFPFEPGTIYQATFDGRMLQRAEHQEVLTLEFTLPKTESAAPVEVTHVFPSSEFLPENLLRFYVRFASSMQRGRCDEEITLLGPDGQIAPDVLYRPPVELWDRRMQYLTILLDPGRLKRMVGPNRELGPPLHVGEHYTLAIGSGMTDLSGRRLGKAFYKRFQVIEPVRAPIDTRLWQVQRPTTGSREALLVTFAQPLDWALLTHAITVFSSNEQPVEGQLAIENNETQWRFTPNSNWRPDAYRIQVTSDLEDVCGNSVLAAFDRPIRTGSDLAYEIANTSITFYLS